jgi:serine/threonine-protein phosphatase 2A regulatory subunit A
METAANMGKELAGKFLVNMLLHLFKDEHTDVRINIVTKLPEAVEVLGSAVFVQSVLPDVINMAKDKKWRVRLAVVSNITLMSNLVGVKNFEKRLQALLLETLRDPIFTVREKVWEQYGSVVQSFGGKWASEKLLAAALIFDVKLNYLHRSSTLYVIKNTCASCPAEYVEKVMLPLVLQGCVDDVANVRIGKSNQ